MKKVSISLGYGGCLLASVLVNIFFFISLIKSRGKLYSWNNNNNYIISWTQSAALEAESVASISCSGHGRVFLDGLIDDDVHGKNPVCECNTCFHGSDCSQFLPDCPADADSGDPLFLEPFWMKNAANSAVLLSGWHRMSYRFPGGTLISEELVKHVRKLHSMAKNAVTDGRYILFGDGSTQLLNAAVFALSPENSSSPAKVVAHTPFYPVYELQTDFFKTDSFEFLGDASMVKNISDGTNIIEFVTSPNNPDGFLMKSTLRDSSASSINDHAYYWPHFTAIPAPADEDVMIFTISKLTGHAGTRLGWAIIKDENVYSRMQTYIQMSQLVISKDVQLRALKLLKVIVKNGGKEIFDFGYKRMRDRWNSFNKIMSMSKDFSPQEISPQYCSFLNRIREPSPAYAWLKCEREEHRNCTEVLRRANIIGRSGRMFSADDRYVRLSLLKNQDDFEQLMYRLKQLVSNEGEGAKVM